MPKIGRIYFIRKVIRKVLTVRFSGHLVYVDQSLARPVPEFQRLVFNLALETGFQLAPISTNVTYDQIIYYTVGATPLARRRGQLCFLKL